MATWVYPPIAPEQLRLKEDESLTKELAWLLESFQEALAALKEGLEECVALLAPREPGSTLVLSSQRSENVKGFVTRVGTKLVKGDITLRLPSLPPNIPRGTPTYPSTHHTIPPSSPTSTIPDITLPPLLSLANALSAALDIIDITRWTGPRDSAPFIQGQINLLATQLATARRCLRGPSPLADVAEGHSSDQATAAAAGGEDDGVGGSGRDRDESEDWWTASCPAALFDPPLHPNLSLHFSIFDAALVLTVRTVSPVDADDQHRSASSSGTGTPSGGGGDFSLSGFNLREKLFGLALGHGGSGKGGAGQHDEIGERFLWRGKRAVEVREKVRVESSGDPMLISVAAKLSALEHEVRRWKETVGVLVGEELE